MIKLFEDFEKQIKTDLKETEKPEQKKKVESTGAEIENYEAPEYVVQPAKDDKGFFMFKKAFDSMKQRFATGFFSTTINNDQ